MEVKQISISLGTTINMGDYQNTKVDVHLVADLEEDDTPEAVYTNLMARARVLLADSIRDTTSQLRPWQQGNALKLIGIAPPPEPPRDGEQDALDLDEDDDYYDDEDDDGLEDDYEDDDYDPDEDFSANPYDEDESLSAEELADAIVEDTPVSGIELPADDEDTVELTPVEAPDEPTAD